MINFLQNILKSENHEIKRFNDNIKKGKKGLLIMHLDQNVIDVNSETKNGETPAYCAISSNKPAEFELLLENKLDLKKSIKGPKSVVWQSVKDCVMSYHNVTMLKSLEEFGEKIDYKSEHAKKCMFDACEKRNLDYIEFMIEKNGFDGSWRNEFGASLLLTFMRDLKPKKMTERHMAIMNKFMDSPEQINVVFNKKHDSERMDKITSRTTMSDIVPDGFPGPIFDEMQKNKPRHRSKIQMGDSPAEIFADWFPGLKYSFESDKYTADKRDKMFAGFSALRDKILINTHASLVSYDILIDLLTNTESLKVSPENKVTKYAEDLLFEKNKINDFDCKHETFAMACARKSNTVLFSRAVDHLGADIEIKNKDGFNCDDIAKKSGSFDIFKKIKSIDKKTKNNDGFERG